MVRDVRPSRKRYALTALISEKGKRPPLLDIEDYVIVGPGAADHRKRWPHENFAKVISYLVKTCHERVIIVGDKADARVADLMFQKFPEDIVNLCGQTSLMELATVLSRAKLALLNDSGVMHMASYLNIPIVALFGPTDPCLYGPWSDRSIAIRKGNNMEMISLEDVTSAMDTFLGHANLQADDRQKRS